MPAPLPVPGAPGAAAVKSKKPLIITLISVLVVALIAGGTFLFLTLSKPKLDGTYAFSSDGKNASLVVHGKNMTLTFPYLGTVTATISKTSKNVNGGYDYTLGGLQISSDVVENVRYYLYFLDYDMSDSAVKSTLQSLNPVLSVPAGFDKGSPVGTWSISCSAFGASADATVTFNADGSLTASASAMRSLSSRWNGKWTQRDTNSYAITGTDGWDAGTFTIQR
ncbi:hypothetical protein ACFPID_03360 [Bifidobacterium leontopitheci]|uniref:hypothetical protein n=1 Tax=Bifidobacterium leontopitheci TaxID=2650774 RepID=UPI00362257C7